MIIEKKEKGAKRQNQTKKRVAEDNRLIEIL